MAAVCAALLVPCAAFSAAPTLLRLFPAGGQRGSTVVTTCTGEFSGPVQVWAPGVEVVVCEDGDEKAAEDGKTRKLEISIPEDLATDRVWIRLYSEEGASAAVPFLIGGLKEFNEEESNDSPSTAQAVVACGVTINGILQKRGDVDGFAVEVSAGQTLVAAVDAHGRLGSPMDAILQIVSAEGTVLAENHDAVGLDPRLVYTATEAQSLVVRLFAFPAEPDSQIAFRGGDDYIYRLTLTTGPFITHTAPLSTCQSEPGEVAVRGWNIPPGTRLPVMPLGGVALGDHRKAEALEDMPVYFEDRVGFVFARGFAGAARIRLVPRGVATAVGETDANGSTTLLPPIAVTGCLREPREADVYRVPLKKGEQVVVSARAQGLDLPTVPMLRLVDPDGALAAETSEAGPAKDALLTHTADKDGDYRLFVTDRFHRGGDRFMYCLTVRGEQADFEITASGDVLVVTPDQPAEFAVKVNRRAGPDGSIGPITIEAVDLPPGVTAQAVVSEPDGSTAKEVALQFSSTGKAFSGPIRIRGTASQPRALERFARTPPKLGASFESLWLSAIAKP